MMRIIDDKQVELTDAEWNEYQRLCKDYTTATVDGRFLFRGLISVDEETGCITSLHAGKGHLSMEIWLFLSSVMQHQHLRLMYKQLNEWKEQFQIQAAAHMKEIAEAALKDTKKTKLQ